MDVRVLGLLYQFGDIALPLRSDPFWCINEGNSRAA
jgi:hypothetical protein